MIDNQCFERIGFFLSAKALTKLDLFSNSDPFAVVYTKDPKTGVQSRLGFSGVIMNTQNPEWPEQFIMNYHFESVQEITIKVFDKDGNAPLDREDRHDFCG